MLPNARKRTSGWTGIAAGTPDMRHSLQRFIAYGEDIIRRAERGDWDALMICGFANMTAVSIVVIALAVVFNLVWK